MDASPFLPSASGEDGDERQRDGVRRWTTWPVLLASFAFAAILASIALILSLTLGGSGSSSPATTLPSPSSGVNVKNSLHFRAENCRSDRDCKKHGYCVSGECICEAAKYGRHCEQDYCVHRSDCHDHGDCMNGECHCDAYWSGHDCAEKQAAPCPLSCQHGGIPDSPTDNCTACLTCEAGWTGPLCADWNPSSASPEQLTQEVRRREGDARAVVEQLSKSLEPPLPGTIGTGFDIYTMQLRLPAVALSYNEKSNRISTPRGKVFRQPVDTIYRTLNGKADPTFETHVFRGPQQYDQFLGEVTKSRSGVLGVIGDKADVFEKQFRSGCHSWSVSQQRHAIYEIALTQDGSIQGLSTDPYMQSAIDYLPESYNDPEAKRLYRLFIDLWGTSFTVQADVGAAIQTTVNLVSTQAAKTVADISIQSAAQHRCNLGDAGACSQVRAEFVSSRVDFRSEFLGGLAEVTDVTQWQKWLTSIEEAPIQLSFQFRDIWELIQHPAKRVSMQLAVQAYLEEKRTASRGRIDAASVPRVCPNTYEIKSVTSSGVFEARCTPGKQVLSCGLNPINNPEVNPAAVTSADAAGCRCYDYFGATCFAVCAQYVDPSTMENPARVTGDTYQVQRVTRSGQFNVDCPAGKVALGCGMARQNEAFPAANPSSPTQCMYYNAPHPVETTTNCASAAAFPELQIVRASGASVRAVCPNGKRVVGCGYRSNAGGREQWIRWYPENEHTCFCYNYFGTECSAICARI
eukprot:GILJ01006344.1.p1 GENE.GILJ01006344.1~~GILJ01006344.1.p1  ORF type:complete len:746 (+),score=59.28 GILJ01006344.1:48-2285(+)